MSTPRRRKQPARSNRKRRSPAPANFWGGDGADTEAPDVIRASEDPTAMVRSLGAPPLAGRETAAEHYFAAVYDKAAGLAQALAATAGLLGTDDD